MATITIILKQVITMFILAFVGFLMFKYKKITNEGSKTIGNILIYLSLPCVIMNSFMVERTPEKMKGLLISAALALAMLFLAMGISRLVLGRNAIENFAGSFANPGFFGVPIIVASLAEGSVFYIAPFIACINMGQWTYGVWLLNYSKENGELMTKAERAEAAKKTGEKQGSKLAGLLKKLFTAPFMVGIIAGLFFFLTGLRLPEIPTKCVDFIADINTPLAMFTIGIYLAQTDLKKMFSKLAMYKVSLVRMILVPAAAIAVLSLIPNTMLDLKLPILIAASCPVGSNVAVYAQLHNRDYSYAVETVIISTMVSIITIPLVVGVATMLWA